jgi:diguanylate cyclase (GGDEF)-like protein
MHTEAHQLYGDTAPEWGKVVWGPMQNSVGDGVDKGWLLSLAQRLQTTLDPQSLVELFLTETQAAVPFAGVAYLCPSRNLRIERGDAARHSCSYELVVSEQPLGQVAFTRDWPFSDTETARLEFLLSHLVYPLRNALLYSDALQAATRDPLTGIHNRAAFESTLEREVSYAARHGTPLSLLMLDLDHFKRVNDRHGHIAGDCVLKAFVGQVQECVRKSDAAFRYGGEEFALLLRNTPIQGAVQLGERIRQAVAALRPQCESLRVSITVSLGVAQLQPGDNPWSLVDRADRALYESKRSGRNRVTAAPTA